MALSNSEAKAQEYACQDLLSMTGVFSGWLRQKKKLHKLSEMVDQKATRPLLQPLSSMIPWGKRYVVVHDGYLYIYNNETAYKPNKTLDLAEYKQVEKYSNIVGKDVPWPFRVTHRSTTQEIFFGATSQAEQTSWIDAVGKGITKGEESGRAAKAQARSEQRETVARGIPDPDETDDDSEKIYDSIDSSDEENAKIVQKHSKPKPKRQLPQPDAVEYELSPKSESPMSRKHTPMPPTPGESTPSRSATSLKSTGKPPATPPTNNAKPPVQAKPKKTIPPVPEKNKPKPRPADDSDDSVADYEEPNEIIAATSNDDIVAQAMWKKGNEEGTSLMKTFIDEEGIFMIRKSTEGNGDLTLQVVSENAVRKYKISTQGGKYLLGGGCQFDSMLELVQFYQRNNIPRHETKLTKPYSKARK